MKRFSYAKEHKGIVWSIEDQCNRELTVDASLAALREWLAGPAVLDSLPEVAFHLKMIGDWNAITGLDSRIGNQRKYVELWANYLDMLYNSARIRFLYFNRTGQGGLSEIDLLRAFLACSGFNDRDKSSWLGKIILDSYVSRRPPEGKLLLTEVPESHLDIDIESHDDTRNINPRGIHIYGDTPVSAFAMRLFRLVNESDFTLLNSSQNTPECGVYDNLFAYWSDMEQLRTSILTCCDYHVERSKSRQGTDYGIPEFELTPFRQLPFEILGYRNVRRRMGLETPWPAHPLLDSPFVKNLPEEVPPSDDPLLVNVLATVRNVLPEV